MILGVDPGHSGAAVLLGSSARGPVRAWTWARLSRADGPIYRLRSGEAEQEIPTLYGVGVRIAAEAGAWDALAVEGLFAGRNGSAAIELAEATGRLLAALEPGAARIYRPTWSQWAPAILAPGVRASSASVTAAQPIWLAAHGIDSRALDPAHAWDAACIALYGLVREPAHRGRPAAPEEDLIGRVP